MAEGNNSTSGRDSRHYGVDSSNSGREELQHYNGQDGAYPQPKYISDAQAQPTYNSTQNPYQPAEFQATYQQVHVPPYTAGNIEYHHYRNEGPSQTGTASHYDNNYQGYNMNIPTPNTQMHDYHSNNSQIYRSASDSYHVEQNYHNDSSQGHYKNMYESTGQTTYKNSQRYDTSTTKQQNSKEIKTSANNSISERRGRGNDINSEKYVYKDESTKSDGTRTKNYSRGNGRGNRGRGRGGRGRDRYQEDNSPYGYYEEDRSWKNSDQENGQRQYETDRRRGGDQENGQRQYETDRRRGGDQENGQRKYEIDRRRGGDQENGQRQYETDRRRGGDQENSQRQFETDRRRGDQENGQRQYETDRRRGGNRRDDRNRGSRGGGGRGGGRGGGFEGSYRGNSGVHRGRGANNYGPDDYHQQKDRGGGGGGGSSGSYDRGGGGNNYQNDHQHQRDSTLATVTAKMSLRQGPDSSTNDDKSGESPIQRGGPLNKNDRARGGRGDYRRREFEEKQGKDRRNRQTRIEDGVRPHAESYNEDYNNLSQRYNRNDKSYNQNRGNWRNQDRERSHEDSSYNKYSKPNINTGYEPQPSPSRNRNQKNKNKLWNNPKNDLTGDIEEYDNTLDLSVKVEHKEEKRKGDDDDDESQRHRLVEQLMSGTYECMVCVDRIKQPHAIWSCGSCYNCFHLGCIKKWAKTSTVETGWRCPACQNTSPKVPNAYMCFCSKMREPEWNRRDTAHSCGEVCGRLRKIEWCTHKCTLLCHPGPCPPCTAYINKSCACGAESRDVRCSQTEPFFCDGVCGKELNCAGHKCERPCHEGPCGDCTHMITQNCHCTKKTQEVVCTAETLGQTAFCCESICELNLDCGNHKCTQVCHPSKCEPCQNAVELVIRCPCGKVPLEKLYERDGAIQRRLCTDPIPTCSQPCQNQLKCGNPGSYHQCQALCHEGLCPQCPSETPVKCRCGFMDKNIPCSELTTKADEVTCEKQCKKMRQCGRHKCAMKCCIDVDHICSLICSRTLKCGLHKCEDACHRGNCSRCWQTSFEELTCHCGASVLYPPVPCGTKPPSCDQPCRRPATCEHTATHHCHPEDTCPPCTLLVDKPCCRGHKIMRSTPCYVSAVSCGAVCQAPLPCGIHICQRVCHDGQCITNGKCPQKCSRPRESCGHPCANPCHQGPVCPESVCKEKLKISCSCGLRKISVQCSDNDREYKAMATNLLATQMQNMNNGLSVDLSHIFTATARPDKLKRLPCTDDCQTQDRNRRLAIALQIENPETREKLGNSSQLYSDFMKEEARKDPVFAKMVHDALTDLVFKAKESKQKSRSHSFAAMNRDKRQFVHEACEQFGCQGQSYDEEPKKNVVATAVRGMCYLPPLSIMEAVHRDQGQKKVPGPVWARASAGGSSKGADTGHGSNGGVGGMRKLEKSTSLEKETEVAAAKPTIDYFDFDS